MIIKPIRTRVFREGEDLLTFIFKHVKKIPEKTVIVVTSKIVSLSEKRVIPFKTVKEKDEIIRSESEFAMPTKHVWLTIKDGMVMASAGIDESNANGKLILLPKNSFDSAVRIRNILKKKLKLKKIGVLISDSRTEPLRAGVTGAALGYAGFRGIKDYVGKKDIFGRKFQYSRVNVADSVAAGAVLTMGEGNEQKPLALVNDSPVEFIERVNRKELLIKIRDDMYSPLFSKFKSPKK